MKVRDAIVVAAVATATLLGSIGLWRSLGQAIAKEKVAPKPTMTVDGVTLSLDLDKQTHKPDEKRVLLLTAANATGSPASMTATVRAMSMQLGGRMSRIGPVSREAWHVPCEIALGPNETRTFTITAPKAIPAGSLVTFNVQVGKTTRALAGTSFPGLLLKKQVASTKPVGSKL